MRYFSKVEHSHGGESGDSQPLVFSDEDLMKQVDPVLENDDLNKDGYIDYPEFVISQQKVTVTTG